MHYNLSNYKAKPNKTIEEHTNELLIQLDILRAYGYIKNNDVYRWSKEACKWHDVGKMNDKFQQRVTSVKKIKFNPSHEVPHNILSGCMIDRSEFNDRRDYLLVLYATLYHHDYVDVISYLREEESLIKEALQQFNINKIISARDIRSLTQLIESDEAILTKGILHKCDYCASGELRCEYKADFLQEALETFLEHLKLCNQNKEITWNMMQQYCRHNTENNIIVVAQTGMGKTEGGLWWIGNYKGFFVLPLRTAINAIYERIKKDILVDNNIKERVAILHSSSLAYYIESKNNTEDQEIEEIMHYEKLGKQWSIPLNITTMDQIFDFVFKYQGYELKLATLAYSKIVVDEIQMYDPQLLAYLIYGLERIHQLGGKIAIITATLPPFIEELLCKHINFEPKREFYSTEVIRHHLQIKEEEINIQDICNQYRENQKEGISNKILIICNTVRKAREVYEGIREVLGDKVIRMLHSRFIRNDRAELEQQIKQFGSTYNKQGELDCNEGIWVSTSIVEASLDIDFDYLFTELQDLNSLFQRLGRCNRKGVKSIERVNCYVYTEIDKNIIIHGNKGFIDDTLYQLSKKAIQNRQGLLSEQAKVELINSTFTSENMHNSHYINQYRETYDEITHILPYKFNKKDIILRNIFTQDIIPGCIYTNKKQEIDELIEQLNSPTVTTYNKIRLEEQLMGYTVAIPSYEVDTYTKAILQGKAERYPVLKWGKYHKLQIIDCEYDSRGFVAKTFNSVQTGEGEFL